MTTRPRFEQVTPPHGGGDGGARGGPPPARGIAALLVAITLLKLALAQRWGWTADIAQTFEQASAFLAGRDILDPQSTGGNPSFFLLGHYWLAALCLRVSEWAGLPFAFVVKIPAILADLAVSWLLMTTPRGGTWLAFLYMVNPVTFLLSVYHGQLHTVAVAGAVATLWLVERRRWAVSGLLLGLAVSVRQHFAALLVPLLLWAKSHRWRLLIGCVAAVAILNIPLVRSRHLGRLLSPTWTYGSWGYTLLLLQGPRLLELVGVQGAGDALQHANRTVQQFGSWLYLLWVAGYAIWVWQRRDQPPDPWRATLAFLVGLYAISPGFGVQWLVWVIPFWLVVNRREAVRYSILAGAFLAGSYWQWGLNAKYGIGSLTASLGLLSRADLAGVLLVGLCGLLAWASCVRATWRLARG